MSEQPALAVGDPVSKVGGDYRFDGWVMAAFPKRSGVVRYVVEDDRGVLHIYSVANLVSRKVAGATEPYAQSALTPASPHPTLTQGEIARERGYTGDACGFCGGFSMRRAGTCQLCEICHQTSGGCS